MKPANQYLQRGMTLGSNITSWDPVGTGYIGFMSTGFVRGLDFICSRGVYIHVVVGLRHVHYVVAIANTSPLPARSMLRPLSSQTLKEFFISSQELASSQLLFTLPSLALPSRAGWLAKLATGLCASI